MASGSPNLTLCQLNCAPIVEAREGLGVGQIDRKQRVLLWDTNLKLELSICGHNAQRRTEGEKKNQGRCWWGPSHESSNARLRQTTERGRGRQAGRLRGLAYPFGLGAHGWLLGVVGWSIRKVDLHIIRHFFQEV